MNINEGDGGAEEKGAMNMRGIDELADLILEFLGERDLLVKFLLLENAIEAGYYMAIYLYNCRLSVS